jgi:lactoylglutathione lyase
VCRRPCGHATKSAQGPQPRRETRTIATELFPILTTRDLEAALRFYRDLLGGRITFEFPGPDGVPGYVGIELGRSHLGIGRDPAGPDPADLGARRAVSLWIYVADCDATIEALRAADVPIDEEPSDQPWGERVARVRDPDGNEVIVGSRPGTLG